MIVSSFLLKTHVIDRTLLSTHSTVINDEIASRYNDFKLLLKDTALTKRLLTANETAADMESLWNKPYYFFLYSDGDQRDFLRFWNNAQIIPPDSLLFNDEWKEVFAKLSNGYYYIVRQRLSPDTTVTAYCMMLIKSGYYISTGYLTESFIFDKSLDNVADISTQPNAYPVKSPTGKKLFFLQLKPDSHLYSDDEASILLRLGGLFLFFLSIYLWLHQRYTRRNVVKDIYIFVACLLAFRLLLYALTDLLNLKSFKLFDPHIYSSGIYLPSLGDLLISNILFCTLAGFIWQRTTSHKLVVKKFESNNAKWIYRVLSLSILVFTTLAIVGTIRSLVSDSKISFDVTNFFSLNIFTAVGFLVIASLCLGFFYFTRFLFSFSMPVFKDKEYLVYFIIAIVGLAFCSINIRAINFYLPTLVWLLFYSAFFLNEDKFKSFFSLNITGVVVWIFIFSISISTLMLNEIRKKELLQRKLYVEKLATQNDEASVRVISIAFKYISNDFFIKNISRFANKELNGSLRDSIVESSYINYLNNYNASIYVFDSINQPLNNATDLTLESFNTIIEKQSIPTSQSDLYFYETGFDKFSYITRRQFVDETGKKFGTIIILSDPKKFANINVNPELFKQYGQWELSHPSVYYYAVYKNKLLSSSTRQYPFTSTLFSSEIPVLRFEERFRGTYSELWHRPNASTVVVMARRSELLLETITLFSYIFCAFLFLLVVINVFVLVVDWLLSSRLLKTQNIFQPTIRRQIHNTFILITLLSFVVVGVTTVSFFIDRFGGANNDRLSRTMSVVLNQLQSRADLSNLIYQERLTIDTVINEDQLNEIIKEVSDIHGVDVNVYDIRGNLLGTSSPDLYQKGIISSRMGSKAFYSLRRQRSIEHIQAEQISQLNYTSIYAPLRDRQGALYAYLSIPFFTSQHELNQAISNFLVTLINLNAFIFLITGLVALIITNRITRSFRLVGEKMKEVSLSKSNELIQWDTDDEIGSLVKEYNIMVEKLQKSADELASSERQSAWREMARQVAHEIKNPLTPMKLSLQYLQRAIAEKRQNIDELAANVSKTLVEQIDHLSKIASDFSQFANIGAMNREVFDLHHTISQLRGLHSNNQKVEFIWHPLPQRVNILADKTQINRLFTNLITNAIESSSENAKCVIKIHERIDGDFIVIGVEDNGMGITDEMKIKIFVPNFTTKTSGTGLGLAMSKAIVEQSRGSIWFETKVGMGSTFFVRLPLAES